MINISKNQKGSALIIVLLLILALNFMMVTSLHSSNFGLKISKNYYRQARNYNLAELGLNKVKLLLSKKDSFSQLLNPVIYEDGIVFSKTYKSGDRIKVKVLNNTEGLYADYGGKYKDTDGLVIIRSSAYSRSGSQTQIEAYVGKPQGVKLPDAPLEGRGAIAACGKDPNIFLAGNAVVQGTDEDIADEKSGDKKNSKEKTKNKLKKDSDDESNKSETSPAIIFETQSLYKNQYKVSGRKVAVSGYPQDVTTGIDMNCSEWLNLSNQLAALKERENVNLISSHKALKNAQFGTEEKPMITIIGSMKGNLNIKNNSSGAGILIIAGNNKVTLTKNFRFKGLVIILGDRSRLKVTGSSEISGHIIVNKGKEDSERELEVVSNAKVIYSPEDFYYAARSLGNFSQTGSNLVTYSWQEKF